MGELEDVALESDLLDRQGQVGDGDGLALLEQPDLGEILAGGGDGGQFDLGPEQAPVDEIDAVGIGVVERRRLAQTDDGATPVQMSPSGRVEAVM